MYGATLSNVARSEYRIRRRSRSRENATGQIHLTFLFFLRFNDESARTSCVDDTYTPLTPGHLDHDTLFVSIRGLYTVVSKRLEEGMWGNFRWTFFLGAWWKESKRRFWQRSFLLVDNSLYYYWLIDSIYGFTCDLPDYGENCIGKMIMIMKTKVFSIWRLNNDDL